MQGIFATRCANCHTSGSSAGLTGLNDYDVGYDNLVNEPSTEEPSLMRVEPSDSTLSYLMHKLDGTQEMFPGGVGTAQMPLAQPPLSQLDRDGIRAWINSGAPKN